MSKRSYVAVAQESLPEAAPPPADDSDAPPLRMGVTGRTLPVPPPARPDHVFDPVGGVIPSDEPVFILRATDQSADAVLAYWLSLNAQNAPHLAGAVQDMIRRMQQWEGRHPAGQQPLPQEEF